VSSGAQNGTAKWKLVWHDEFKGRVGAPPSSARWNYEIGCSGWGNNELECYTNRRENVRQDGKGHLEIVARKEAYGGREYTSARILTDGLFERKYGRFEARMRIPAGQGLWPAYWMLGANFFKVGWPRCGEIDVMEAIGREPATVSGAIHGSGYIGEQIGSVYTLPSGALADGYRVYAVEWSAKAITWFVDGHRYLRLTPSDLPLGARWAFDHPLFLILNLAVGGDWPGSPDASTVFPATLLVDYVRVYRRAGSAS
jgi:beta-glucanase (GH16 family)